MVLYKSNHMVISIGGIIMAIQEVKTILINRILVSSYINTIKGIDITSPKPYSTRVIGINLTGAYLKGANHYYGR